MITIIQSISLRNYERLAIKMMNEEYLSCDAVNVIYSAKCYMDIDFLAFACWFELGWGKLEYQWPADR